MRAVPRVLLLLACLTLSLSGAVWAQKLTFLVTGGSPVAFPNATEANYDAGLVGATAMLGFSMSLGGGGGAVSRTGILSIRAASAAMGGTKPIGDLQWRRSDLATWNSLTPSDVVVQSLPMIRGGLNDPWTNSIAFRTLLSWANDGPAT
ncbi:MAG: hypothetical protein ABJB33_07385, partial [Gemmatimonadota bacterium]